MYFIQGEATKAFKIGISISPEERLCQLQSYSPDVLNIIAVIGPMDWFHARDRETQLHRKFTHLRMHGEWFSCGDEIIDYIKDSPWVVEQQNAVGARR